MVNWVEDTAVDLDRWYETPAEAAYVRPASSWSQDVINRIEWEQDAVYGTRLPWHKALGRWAIRPAELTIWAGINGHGKSLITGQVALEMCAQGEKVGIASLEMRPATTLYRLTRQALGEASPMRERVSALHHATDGLLWIYDQMGTVQWQRIVALGRYMRSELGIQHLFIDSLLKLGIGPDDYGGQKKATDELIALARDTGLHIHLVHHARKGSAEDHPIDKFSIKGAGEIVDMCDNAVIMWRNKRKEKDARKDFPDQDIQKQPDLLLDVCKQRDGEWEGHIGLFFHATSMQFTERVGPPYEYLERLTQ